MPFFSNKFSPKKSKIRKSTLSLTNEDLPELLNENRIVKLQLGDSYAYFQNGTWKLVSNEQKGNQKLKSKVQELEEENNLLKLKLEILLNMLTQATAEKQLQLPEFVRSRKNESAI